jgi:MFS family permease
VWVAGRGGADARRTAGVALALFAASLLAVAFSRHVGLAAAARALGGLSMIVFFATANAAVQMRVPDAIRGRVMALWTLVFSAALPLGGLVLSEAARATSVPTAFGGGASVVLAAALASLVFGRGQRSRETT